MEKTLYIKDFSSVEVFIEFLYIHGIHRQARNLCKALGLQLHLTNLKEKYSSKVNLDERTKHQVRSSLKAMAGQEDSSQQSLLNIEDYYQLTAIAQGLQSGSKILEVGTYKGASTLALAIGSEKSSASITCMDLYMGFKNEQMTRVDSPLHNEYLVWQKNVNHYCNRINSIHGSSISGLQRLVSEGVKYDLIFLDSSHALDTFFELALISCLANPNSIIILDDVINYNWVMTTTWAMGLKHFLCFPRFSNKLSIANFKISALPINISYEPNCIFESAMQLDNIFKSFEEDNIKAYTKKHSNSEFTINFCTSI